VRDNGRSRAALGFEPSRHRFLGLVLGAVTAVIMLALPATASATSPSLQAPASGSSFEAESPPTFVATDDPPPNGTSVYLSISTSPAVNAAGQLGTDVTFAQMLPSAGSSTTYDWSPPSTPGYYPWTPGTYYWQVSHVDCFATPTCEVTSAVWQFVITPVPPPQPLTPPDGATVQAGTTVYFTVYSALAGDLGTRIVFPSSSGSSEIAPYGFLTDEHTSLFRVQLGDQPGTLTWTVVRADCRLSSACPLVLGPTRHLTVVAPPAPPHSSPKAACRRGFTRATIGGRRVCLHAGEFCARAHARQYRRYGYACVLKKRRYRLVRRH
jgi:hypothetical protein